MITSWIIGKARAAALHEGAATVTAEDLQRQAFRWSEQLRKAIRRRDPDDAAAVFASVLDSAPASDAVALTAVLVAELAQYVEDEGVGDYAHAEHPVLTDLLDDCRVFGRSEEFFSEVLLYLVEADPDQQATIVTDLISASITAASLPSEQDRARWTDEWWRQVYPCALDEALEDAVLAMVDRGDLSPPDFMWRLSAYTIESLGALALHDDGLVLLEQHSPEAADLIYAYSEGHGRSQLLAVRRELDSIGPSDFGDVAIRILSALIVLERQDRASPEAHSPSDDASADPLTRWQDGQQLTWSDEHETWLGVVVDAKGSRYLWAEDRTCWVDETGEEWNVVGEGERIVRRDTRRAVIGDDTVEWSDEHGCWVAEGGGQWVVDPLSNFFVQASSGTTSIRAGRFRRTPGQDRLDQTGTSASR